MATCPICEREFDERGYQVVVTGLGSFDSIECVEAALRRRGRDRRDLVPDLTDAISSAREKDAERAGPTPTDRGN